MVKKLKVTIISLVVFGFNFNGKVYVDYRIKTSYSIIGLYTATNFITLSALPWVLPGAILNPWISDPS